MPLRKFRDVKRCEEYGRRLRELQESASKRWAKQSIGTACHMKILKVVK